jgi:cytoskeletal protein CcmA (bactofilin family)
MATFEWETLSSTRPAARDRGSAPAGNGSDGEHRSLVLGPRDRLIGQLYIEGDLRVVGTVEGALEVTGSVEIDEGGKVTGPVTARDRLVVGRAGSLKGDVRVARLVVQDGATFSGNVSMGKPVDAPPTLVDAAPAPEPVKPQAPAVTPEPIKAQGPAKPPEPIKAQTPAKPPEPVKAQTAAKAPEPIKGQTPAKPPQPIKAQTPAKAPEPIKLPPAGKQSATKPKRR